MDRQRNNLRASQVAGKLRRSAGLAPLEFVLALPLLLFMMALMVNCGNVAGWKVRSLGVARNELWANRPPRNLSVMHAITYWPTKAAAGVSGAGNATVLDDARAQQPIARGPTLPYGTTVYSEVLNPARGLLQGNTQLTEPFPMFARTLKFTQHAENVLLDDKWQYWRMNWGNSQQRTGLGWNDWLRIPVIYELAQADAGSTSAYIQAALAILYNPNRTALDPLDNDPDARSFVAQGLWGGVPNFYQYFPVMCTLDHDKVQKQVDALALRIEGGPKGSPPGVPKNMTRYFLNMYQAVENELQARLKGPPPLPPGQAGPIQSEIALLQGYISQLQSFLKTLP